MPSPTDDETPFPRLDRSATFNSFGRSHLSPDDAFTSPPLRSYGAGNRSVERMDGERSRSRRRKRAWKKLMWVKQSYPDNYTDQATFLESLQRNPRLKPYDFWPLVADSIVILQHVCSVIIFLVCFVGISKDHVSPVSVVSWSSTASFVGWLLWERWVTEEDEAAELLGPGTSSVSATVMGRTGSIRRRGRAGSLYRPLPLKDAGAILNTGPSSSLSNVVSASDSAASSSSNVDVAQEPSNPSSNLSLGSNHGSSQLHTPRASQETLPQFPPPMFAEENRTHQRLGTIKSAILIWSTLLGMSPILKSLTKSTSSDSIWAMSCWLLAINIFFFDYSGGVGAKFPASLSTNAALMASTVLASRLPSTKQVFSITLFSIEVFGLFPVFRRYVQHRSWRMHVALAVALVLGAGFGMGMTLGEGPSHRWTWTNGIVGMVVNVFIAAIATGGCSWWLIGLQKYKNEIRGPWDPARPIIMSRTRWDEK
ncbi:hypothetical protein NLU13_4087 [Sarocladium strictum]|uniref:Phosphatidylinositol N-acetylglucosaminyltransferase n=1 Tax=Sarocladium strictum TaxID=5046 RepID=A0AA39L8B4_SARSR|nr:hypothetical protein NLU13_4087 [Sarocladium strictum]